MKLLVTLLLLLGIAAFSAFTVVITAPYYYYYQAINNKYRGPWFALNFYQDNLLTPKGSFDSPSSAGIQGDVWKSFQFQTAKISIPVKNPYFIIVPIINYEAKNNTHVIGLSFIQPSGLQLGKILFLPSMMMSKDFRRQQLFKLPIVRQMLDEMDYNKLWNDIFTKDISGWNIPYQEMLYNMYLLQKRVQLVPQGAKDFGLLPNGMALLQLPSEDKDFKSELVYHHKQRLVHGIYFQWRVNNEDSNKLRRKILDDLSFEPSSPSLTSFIYQEFQQLPYSRQIDHEGLAYLFSAWSHQMERRELIQAMIYYLERGKVNERQLKPLYEYASQKYDTTFSNLKVDNNLLDGQALLKQNIELENKDELLQRERTAQDKDFEPENETLEQRMHLRMENAKKIRERQKDTQIIMD